MANNFKEVTLREILQNAKPYVGQMTSNEFSEKLFSCVENAEEKFSQLWARNEYWRNAAKHNNFNVYFFYTESMLKNYQSARPATLVLKLFERGSKPVICVSVYTHGS